MKTSAYLKHSTPRLAMTFFQRILLVCVLYTPVCGQAIPSWTDFCSWKDRLLRITTPARQAKFAVDVLKTLPEDMPPGSSLLLSVISPTAFSDSGDLNAEIFFRDIKNTFFLSNSASIELDQRDQTQRHTPEYTLSHPEFNPIVFYRYFALETRHYHTNTICAFLDSQGFSAYLAKSKNIDFPLSQLERLLGGDPIQGNHRLKEVIESLIATVYLNFTPIRTLTPIPLDIIRVRLSKLHMPTEWSTWQFQNDIDILEPALSAPRHITLQGLSSVIWPDLMLLIREMRKYEFLYLTEHPAGSTFQSMGRPLLWDSALRPIRFVYKEGDRIYLGEMGQIEIRKNLMPPLSQHHTLNTADSYFEKYIYEILDSREKTYIMTVERHYRENEKLEEANIFRSLGLPVSRIKNPAPFTYVQEKPAFTATTFLKEILEGPDSLQELSYLANPLIKLYEKYLDSTLFISGLELDNIALTDQAQWVIYNWHPTHPLMRTQFEKMSSNTQLSHKTTELSRRIGKSFWDMYYTSVYSTGKPPSAQWAARLADLLEYFIQSIGFPESSTQQAQGNAGISFLAPDVLKRLRQKAEQE